MQKLEASWNTRVDDLTSQVQKSQETWGEHAMEHSIPVCEPRNNTDEVQIPLAKMPKKRTLPPRGLGGMFLPKSLSDTKKFSSTFTSSASSPLDMPETNEWQLTPDEEELESCEVSDCEVRKDLREDNEESLPDAPRPNTILLPAFQWGTGIPLSIPREPSMRTVPSAQPPTTKVIMSTMSANSPPLFHRHGNENSANFI